MGASAGARSPGTAATEAAKLQTAPSPPARRPPGRLMGAHSQPAQLAPRTPAAGTARAGAGGSGRGRGTGVPAAAEARPGPLSPPPLLPCGIWLGFPLQTGNLTAPRPGGAVTRMAGLRRACPRGRAPEGAPPPALPYPWVPVPELGKGSEKPGLHAPLLTAEPSQGSLLSLCPHSHQGPEPRLREEEGSPRADQERDEAGLFPHWPPPPT